MDNKEYIIINKTTTQKRVEELRQVCNRELGYASDKIYFELDNLLSQSTPLIPEIEKAFDAGKDGLYQKMDSNQGFYVGKFKGLKQDYISNLKLDI